MIIHRHARSTLTPFELDRGDTLEFKLIDGEIRRITLLSTKAWITETNLPEIGVEMKGGKTNYRFSCQLDIDGHEVCLEREIATQNSFYEPWEFFGIRLWFDAVTDIFTFLNETHGECRPRKQARFAVQDARLRICPVRLHPWCPLPPDGLRIEDCYNGEDCWLGAYFGASAHGGLDINHPAGTPIWAPLDIHDHFYFNSVQDGANNNRWRGLHFWSNGSQWILQTHHMIRLTVPEHSWLPAGTQFAEGAGVWVGSHEHSHFVFRIFEYGELYHLDPWILFWQMYRDQSN